MTFLLDTQPDYGAEEDGFISIDPNLAMSWVTTDFSCCITLKSRFRGTRFDALYHPETSACKDPILATIRSAFPMAWAAGYNDTGEAPYRVAT